MRVPRVVVNAAPTAVCAVALALAACARGNHRPSSSPHGPGRRATAFEQRVAGCYAVTPRRLDYPQVPAVLVLNTAPAQGSWAGQGLQLSRGPYRAAFWRAGSDASVELQWTYSATETGDAVTLWDLTTARLTARGDTLAGSVHHRSDARVVGLPDSAALHAIRTPCAAPVP